MPDPTASQPGTGGHKRAPAPAKEPARTRLEDRTRTELYQLARELGIAGRDEMSRAELIEAIRRR